MRKKAFITGITGQDGSYLAEFLLQKGYEVHGLVRRSSVENTSRIKELIQSKEITLHEGDMTDACGLLQIIRAIDPDEIYNLAAQSHVQSSFESPLYSCDVDAMGVLRILDIVHTLGLIKHAVYIRHRPRSCMERWRQCLRMRTHHFIHTVLMQ